MNNKEKLLLVAIGITILLSIVTLAFVTRKAEPQAVTDTKAVAQQIGIEIGKQIATQLADSTMGVGWPTQPGMEIMNEISSTTHAINQLLSVTNITATGTATLAAVTASGATTLSGGATFTGNVKDSLGFYGLFYASSTFVTPTTATNTLCAIQNTTGEPRRIADIAFVFASTTAPKVGEFIINVGTSSNAYVTSTSPIINTSVITQNGKAMANTTSTINTIMGGWPAGVATDTRFASENPIWQANEYLVFKATTTTAPGRCRVLAY
jgi:hypothetical protein